MPTYDWKCKKCGRVRMGMVKMGEVDKAKKMKLPCTSVDCDGKMEWQFPAPAGRVH